MHDAFQKTPAEEHQGNPNITVCMPTHETNERYLQIVLVLISSSTGKRKKTYALLDTWSKSTLIREVFAAERKLHRNKTKLR